jgi:hypothetical protein
MEGIMIEKVRIKPSELMYDLRTSMPTLRSHEKALGIKRPKHSGYKVHDANRIKEYHKLNYKYTKQELLILAIKNGLI